MENADSVVCNLCGYSEFAVVIDGRFGQIVKCNQCGLMFRTTTIDFPLVEHAGGVDRLAQQYEAKQAIQLVDYDKSFPIIERILERPTRKLLEIGSHTGHFLDLARKKGWDVKGVEPDRNAARRSIERFGLDVSVSDLRGAEFEDESFDVVMMFHVIEHFSDPASELAEIHRILQKGGVLVAETPRFDTIWFKVLKERERSVIPDHLFYFTRRTLSEMVSRADLSVLYLESVGRTLSLERLITAIAKVIGSRAVNRFLVKISVSFDFDQYCIHVNTHDMMRIYARKD